MKKALRQQVLQHYKLVALALWVAGVALVLLVSQRERHHELERVTIETRITGEQVQLRLEACLAARVALVHTLATLPWEDVDAIRSGWVQRAEPLAALLPGVLALNYVGPGSVIEIVVPKATNIAALRSVLFDNPQATVSEAIRATRRGAVTRTDPVELLQSGRGFASYAPIHGAAGELLGYANGVFRLRPLMETCLAESSLEENFRLALFEPGQEKPFYRKPVDAAPGPWPSVERFPVTAADRPWRMEVAPRPTALTAVQRLTEVLILVAGIPLATLAALLAALLLAKQRSLEESRARYRFLVETQSDFVIQLDARGRLTYASPSFCRSQGTGCEQLIGQPFADLLESEAAERLDALRQALANPPHEATAELRTRTTEGARWIAWSLAGVANESGGVAFINANGRDLTDLRLLEDRVAHVDKMRALGELAGGITHDFNNLLQVMLGNLELLKLDAAGEQQEQLQQLENATLRAMRLTGKLATLSRQDPVDLTAVDLSRLVPEVTALIRHTLPSTITVQEDAPEAPLIVQADAAQLEQVLLNLAFNARDSIAGHGTIRIELREVSLDAAYCRTQPGLEPGPYAHLSVTDTGSGIAPENLPKIFDAFFTTKGTGAGQGLGLSNCDSIVRRHGGVIFASSPPAGGSTFSVLLPVSDGDVAAPVPSAPAADRAPAAGGVILIADDDEEVLGLADRILSGAGYRTLCVTNGHDAVVTFHECEAEIGMVIMDLVMPVMDGREAAAKIRELSDTVYILFMSGFVPDEDTQDMAGEPLLRKPFKSSDLLLRAAEVIGNAP